MRQQTRWGWGQMRGGIRRGLGTALAAGMLLAAGVGCGRVDLNDLTPEAVRTQEAAAEQTRAAGGSVPTPTLSGTQGTGGSGGFEGADLAAGRAQYGTWCQGCHDSGRAPSLMGKVYDFAAIEQPMRTGTGFAQPHPKYTVFELTNQQIVNILAFVSGQPAQ